MGRCAQLSTLTCVMWSAAVVLGLPAAARAQKPPPAERPTYKIGDKWIRNEHYVLTRIDGGAYVFEAGAGHEVHLTTDFAITKVVVRGDTQFEISPAPGIAWPLQVGKFSQRPAVLLSRLPRPLSSFPGSLQVIYSVA